MTIITYGLLDRALRAWGLIRREKDNSVIYFDEGDPVIVYPQYSDNEVVPPRYIVLARRQVIERGLAQNQKEFEQALERAAA